MNAPQKMQKVIDGIRYNVEKATLIADDVYWDGHNMERNGRNTFLYRTANGRYFAVNLSQWQGERDSITPLSANDARGYFENVTTEHYVDWAEAFPDFTPTEA